MVRQISVFEAQEIGGKLVGPLCEPVDSDTISTSVAAATNLIWFSMHIALAKGDRIEAGKLARMIESIAEIEVEDIEEDVSEDYNQMMERINEALEADPDQNNDDEIP